MPGKSLHLHKSGSIVQPAPFVLHSGRKLSWIKVGDPEGFPVFYFHGTPGSAWEATVFAKAASSLGIQLICPDRPGVAGSNFVHGRKVVHWARDVRQMADGLGLDEFSLVGWSGGAPHALLTAAELLPRVRALGMLGPQGHTPSRQTKIEDKLAKPFHWLIRTLTHLDPIGSKLVGSSFYFDDLSRRHRHDPRLYQEVFARSLRRGLLPGVRGTVRDSAALASDWGMPLATVIDRLEKAPVPLPITIWQGGKDVFVKPAVTRQLAKALPHCRLIEDPYATHLQILLDHTWSVMRAMKKPRFVTADPQTR